MTHLKPMSHPSQKRPWYKEPWLWLVILLPVSAVIAGIATVIIAYQNKDDLVVDNYYQQGLAINQNLEEMNKAKALNLTGFIQFKNPMIQLQLNSNSGSILGDIKLDVIHPTKKALDRHFHLKNKGNNLFTTTFTKPIHGKRYLRLTSSQNKWIIDIAVNIVPNLDIPVSTKKTPHLNP